jgi:aspartate aminotransferase
MRRLSQSIQQIEPSQTLLLNALASERIAAGRPVLKFGTGEPDVAPPAHVTEAVRRALEDKNSGKYTAADGTPRLKKAVCGKFLRENGIRCTPEQVIVTDGGKHALYELFRAILDPGDEVIVPSPYWVSYADQIRLCGGKVVNVNTSANHFKLTVGMVEKAITPNTCAVIVNTPGNPTGAVIDEAEIRAIGDLALRHGFWVISDEVYEHFIYGDSAHFSLASDPRYFDCTLTVNAASKTYAMTGWRIGYAVGPELVIKAMADLQSHSTSNPCSIAQAGALAALTETEASDAFVRQMKQAFSERCDKVYEAMRDIPGFKLHKPEGAFYAFPDVSGCYGKGVTSGDEVARLLLEEADVAVVPGSAFGAEGKDCFRFSFAASMADIEAGLDRIRDWVSGR